MTHVRLPVFCVLLVGPVLAGTPARGQEKVARPAVTKQDVEESLGTDWYGLYALGKKVGYARLTIARTGEGREPGYETSVDLHVTFRSAGAKVEHHVSETLEFDATPPFALRRGSFSETDAGSARKAELVRAAKGYAATQTVDGATKTKPLESFDYPLSEDLLPRVWVRRGPRVGDRLACQSFEFDKLRLDPETRKVVSVKTGLAAGAAVRFYEVEMTSPQLGIGAVERYDENGRLLSGQMGGVMEMRAEPEALAKDVDKSADLFWLGTVKVDKPLGDPRRVSGLVIEVAGEGGAAVKAGPRQRVDRGASGARVCKLGAAYGPPAPASEQEVRDYLAGTDDYPTGDEKVRALAAEAVGDAKTPRQKVDRLVRFVHRYITPDDRVRPHRVPRLLELRKGMCTEYALLFATLARAAGVPAREAFGLMYMGDELRSFGPHAWNEVVLDGQWVPVDAAWNETALDAAHVRLGASGAGEAKDLGMVAQFLATFGKLSFRVVEVKRGD
jgi:hypothetical protein